MSKYRLGDYQGREGKIGYTFWGLLLAPMIGGAVSAMISALPLLVFGNEEVRTSLNLPAAMSMGFLIGAFLGLPAALTLGLPIHLLLLRYGWTSLLHYSAFGAVIAFAMQSTLMLAFNGLSFLGAEHGIWALSLLTALAGAIGGLVFWLIRRPDRDARGAQPAEESET